MMMAQTIKSMTYATKHQKRTLLVLQDFKCTLCNQEIEGRFECDHIVPLSLGGDSSISNFQVLCLQCHRKKTLTDGSLHHRSD